MVWFWAHKRIWLAKRKDYWFFSESFRSSWVIEEGKFRPALLFSFQSILSPDLCNSSFAFTNTKQLQINCTIVHFQSAPFYKTIFTIPPQSPLLVLNHFWRHIFKVATNKFQGFEIFSGLQQIHSNAFKYFQGCYKCLFCLKISAKCVCTPEEKVTAQMSPKTIHVGTKIVKTWQQLQICKIVFLRSPSASLHTPTSSQFANTWKVAPFWQTPPLLPVKIRKSKIRGCKKYYLQIVEKLLNSGTLAVSSCTNLALIKTAASLENTFIFQNKQKRKKTVEIWKKSK